MSAFMTDLNRILQEYIKSGNKERKDFQVNTMRIRYLSLWAAANAFVCARACRCVGGVSRSGDIAAPVWLCSVNKYFLS